MKEGQVTTSFDLACERHGLIDARQRALQAQRLRLELREQPRVEPSIEPDALIGAVGQRPTNVFRASCSVMETTARPSHHQFRHGAIERQSVLLAEALQGLRRDQRCGGVSAQDFELEFPIERTGHRGSVAELASAADRLIDQFAGAYDFAQLPHGHGEDGPRDGAGGVVETFLCLSVALRVAILKRSLAMDPGLKEIGGLVAGHGEAPARDTGFHGTSRSFCFLEER